MTLSGLSGLAKFIFNDLEHCAVSLRQLSFLLHFAGDSRRFCFQSRALVCLLASLRKMVKSRHESFTVDRQ